MKLKLYDSRNNLMEFETFNEIKFMLVELDWSGNEVVTMYYENGEKEKFYSNEKAVSDSYRIHDYIVDKKYFQSWNNFYDEEAGNISFTRAEFIDQLKENEKER